MIAQVSFSIPRAEQHGNVLSAVLIGALGRRERDEGDMENDSEGNAWLADLVSWAACPKVRGGLTESSLLAAVSSALKLSRAEALASGCTSVCSDVLRHIARMACGNRPACAPQ